MSPHSSHLALRLSLLQALYLSPSTPISKALAPIRACLHSDPDSKPCRAWFRRLKALDKDLAKATNFIEASSWRSVVNVVDPPTRPDEGLLPLLRSAISDASSSGVLPSSPILTDASSRLLTHLLSSLCRAHLSLYQTKLSRPYCEAVLARDPEDIFALVGKGERLMDDEAWEEAVRVLSQAFELGGKRDRDVLQRLQKAQKGLKVSKQKDYYKVIGVPRDVDARTLKKAYRKATLKAHPVRRGFVFSICKPRTDVPLVVQQDKGGSEEKMQALNEAYEVLSNPELRARYDNGSFPPFVPLSPSDLTSMQATTRTTTRSRPNTRFNKAPARSSSSSSNREAARSAAAGEGIRSSSGSARRSTVDRGLSEAGALHRCDLHHLESG